MFGSIREINDRFILSNFLSSMQVESVYTSTHEPFNSETADLKLVMRDGSTRDVSRDVFLKFSEVRNIMWFVQIVGPRVSENPRYQLLWKDGMWYV